MEALLHPVHSSCLLAGYSLALSFFVIFVFFSVFWFSDRLKHPNIVQLLETYEDKSKVYLVMEL